MAAFAQILQGIASLLWPIGIFVTIFIFRKPLKEAIARISKLQAFGHTVELNRELDRLSDEAQAIEVNTVKSANSTLKIIGHPPQLLIEQSNRRKELDSTVRRILDEASRSPTSALINLSAELDSKARQVLAASGWGRGRTNYSLAESIEMLAKLNQLPPSASGSFRLFGEIRNQIVHGKTATEADTLRAIDSGIILLRALFAIPMEENIVHHPGVAIFKDAACTQPYADAKGIVIETTSPGGSTKSFRIFGTTRTDFVKGERLTWEWNMSHTFGHAWYRDTETNEIKKAWDSCAVFVGRDLD